MWKRKHTLAQDKSGPKNSLRCGVVNKSQQQQTTNKATNKQNKTKTLYSTNANVRGKEIQKIIKLYVALHNKVYHEFCKESSSCDESLIKLNNDIPDVPWTCIPYPRPGIIVPTFKSIKVVVRKHTTFSVSLNRISFLTLVHALPFHTLGLTKPYFFLQFEALCQWNKLEYMAHIYKLHPYIVKARAEYSQELLFISG